MADKKVLGYWHIRGLGEGIRYLLEYLNVEYEDKMYLQGPGPDFDRSAWTNSYSTIGMNFPNLPYFWDGDLKISETLAIFEYIASEYGPALAGTNNRQRAEINQLGGVLHGFKWELAMECYNPTFLERKDECVRTALSNLGEVERFLGDKHFLFGEQITWPDFILFELLEVVEALSSGKLAAEHGRLDQYRLRVAALPQLQRRLTGARLPWNNSQAAWL